MATASAELILGSVAGSSDPSSRRTLTTSSARVSSGWRATAGPFVFSLLGAGAGGDAGNVAEVIRRGNSSQRHRAPPAGTIPSDLRRSRSARHVASARALGANEPLREDFLGFAEGAVDGGGIEVKADRELV